jgi:hypothetical protein
MGFTSHYIHSCHVRMNELLYLIVGSRLTASSIGVQVAYFINGAVHVEIQHEHPLSLACPRFDLERGTALNCGRHVEEVNSLRFIE